MKNLDIRADAKNAGVKLWQIADAYPCAEATFLKKLRKELPEPEKQRIRTIIASLSTQN